MKKLIFALGVVACLGLSGCVDGSQSLETAQTVETSDESRFALVHGDNVTYLDSYSIILDTETGVQYMWTSPNGYGGVAFPLYNADGTVSQIEE